MHKILMIAIVLLISCQKDCVQPEYLDSYLAFIDADQRKSRKALNEFADEFSGLERLLDTIDRFTQRALEKLHRNDTSALFIDSMIPYYSLTAVQTIPAFSFTDSARRYQGCERYKLRIAVELYRQRALASIYKAITYETFHREGDFELSYLFLNPDTFIMISRDAPLLKFSLYNEPNKKTDLSSTYISRQAGCYLINYKALPKRK